MKGSQDSSHSHPGKCRPCEGGLKALSETAIRAGLLPLRDWTLSSDSKSISAEYTLKDFAEAVHLVSDIAGAAEDEGHHPDLHLTKYRVLKVVLTTHALGGVSKNDLVLASLISALPKRLRPS